MSGPQEFAEDARPLSPGAPTVELVPSEPPRPASTARARLYTYPGEEEGVHFWDFWHVLNCRRWTVISSCVVTVIAVTIWTFTTHPVYTGTAKVDFTLRVNETPALGGLASLSAAGSSDLARLFCTLVDGSLAPMWISVLKLCSES